MGAIPKLKRAHVQAALKRIDRDGVPTRREATRFQLVAGGKHYPPKYVVSLAAQEAAGRKLRPDEFSGGFETNNVLEALGYKIENAEPVIARVVTRGRRPSSVKAAVEMLHEALGARWPSAAQAKFTITSGGFWRAISRMPGVVVLAGTRSHATSPTSFARPSPSSNRR